MNRIDLITVGMNLVASIAKSCEESAEASYVYPDCKALFAVMSELGVPDSDPFDIDWQHFRDEEMADK